MGTAAEKAQTLTGESEAKEFAKTIQEHLNEDNKLEVRVEKNDSTTVANLNAGYYLIKDKEGSQTQTPPNSAYKLIETVTPSGYNTIQPIIFTIEATYDEESDDPQLTSLTGQTEGEIVFIRKTEEREDSLSTDVINKKGIQLPETGGMGRYLIYTLGTIFVLTALGYTVYKRNRKHTEK